MNGLQRTLGVFFCIIYLVKGNVIVETKSGKVAGVEVSSILKNEKFYSFFSIPYAEPPVGNLRFMVSDFNVLQSYVNILELIHSKFVR